MFSMLAEAFARRSRPTSCANALGLGLWGRGWMAAIDAVDCGGVHVGIGVGVDAAYYSAIIIIIIIIIITLHHRHHLLQPRLLLPPAACSIPHDAFNLNKRQMPVSSSSSSSSNHHHVSSPSSSSSSSSSSCIMHHHASYHRHAHRITVIATLAFGCILSKSAGDSVSTTLNVATRVRSNALTVFGKFSSSLGSRPSYCFGLKSSAELFLSSSCSGLGFGVWGLGFGV